MRSKSVVVDRSLNDREQIEALCATLDEFSRVSGPPTQPKVDEQAAGPYGLETLLGSEVTLTGALRAHLNDQENVPATTNIPQSML
eukprot:4360417-Pyramimonas_sp.AAC.1